MRFCAVLQPTICLISSSVGWQIRPRAPPSLRFSGLPFRKGALHERGSGYVTIMGTNVKDRRHNTSDVMISACVAAERALSAEAGKGLQKTPISTETLCPARFAIFKC